MRRKILQKESRSAFEDQPKKTLKKGVLQKIPLQAQKIDIKNFFPSDSVPPKPVLKKKQPEKVAWVEDVLTKNDRRLCFLNFEKLNQINPINGTKYTILTFLQTIPKEEKLEAEKINNKFNETSQNLQSNSVASLTSDELVKKDVIIDVFSEGVKNTSKDELVASRENPNSELKEITQSLLLKQSEADKSSEKSRTNEMLIEKDQKTQKKSEYLGRKRKKNEGNVLYKLIKFSSTYLVFQKVSNEKKEKKDNIQKVCPEEKETELEKKIPPHQKKKKKIFPKKSYLEDESKITQSKDHQRNEILDDKLKKQKTLVSSLLIKKRKKEKTKEKSVPEDKSTKKIENYFNKSARPEPTRPLLIVKEKQDIPEENMEKILKPFEPRSSIRSPINTTSDSSRDSLLSSFLQNLENHQFSKKKDYSNDNSAAHLNHFDLCISDKEDHKQESRRGINNFTVAFLDFKFDETNNLSIEVTTHDIQTLDPQNLLNDTIITFYLKFLENHFNLVGNNKIYCFNTHFYVYLRNEYREDIELSLQGYRKLSKWGKHSDIFSNKYTAIPINDFNHWSLIIIVNASAINDLFEIVSTKSEDKRDEPMIIYFDSFYGDNQPCIRAIKRFLTMEFMRKAKDRFIYNTDIIAKVEERIKSSCPKVPIQTNTYDCGLFTLAFAELFLQKPDFILNRLDSTEKSTEVLENWFTNNFIDGKRDFLKSLLKNLARNIGDKACFFTKYLKESEIHFHKNFREETQDSKETSGIAIKKEACCK